MARNKDKNTVQQRFNKISIGLASPESVLAASRGEVLKPENIKISEGALREGMIINYINNKKEELHLDLVANFENPRQRSVYELLRKCNWA